MTQGIVFKKAKGEAEDPNGKKIKFSDFLKGHMALIQRNGRVGLNIKKPYVIPKKEIIFNFQLSILNYCVSLRMN